MDEYHLLFTARISCYYIYFFFLFVSFFWTQISSLQMFFRHIAKHWNNNVNNRYVHAWEWFGTSLFLSKDKRAERNLSCIYQKNKGALMFRIDNAFHCYFGDVNKLVNIFTVFTSKCESCMEMFFMVTHLTWKKKI